MFESDFIMRQIQLMTDAINKLVFHKDVNRVEMFEEDGSISGGGLLYHRLKALVAKGSINEAENLLFEHLDDSPLPEYFVVALNFYKDLAALPDAELVAARFSRGEIRDGLSEIRQRMHAIGLDSKGE